MASLTVRGLDEDLVRRLRLRAAAHGRSVAAEHRDILRQALADAPRPGRAAIAERLAAFREAMGDRAAGTAAELLAEARWGRARQLSGQDKGSE